MASFPARRPFERPRSTLGLVIRDGALFIIVHSRRGGVQGQSTPASVGGSNRADNSSGRIYLSFGSRPGHLLIAQCRCLGFTIGNAADPVTRARSAFGWRALAGRL